MIVDDWAQREAERQFPMGRLNPGETGNIGNRVYTHDGAVWMARHLADALLSDEAVEAAAEHFYDEQTGTRGHYPTSMYREKWKGLARAALQAAVRGVTEGESE